VSVYVVRGQRVTEGKVYRAKLMRREMTTAEAVLWGALRGNKAGFHFRRQQVIDGFIADFYCHAAGLVVEADGPIHDSEYDAKRDMILQQRVIVILRFTNDQIFEQTDWVVAEIQRAAANALKSSPQET